MTRGNARGVLLVGAAATLWGTWSLFLRPADVSAFTSSTVVFLVVAVVAAPLTLREQRAAAPGSLRAALPLLLLMAACSAGNVLTYFAALAETTVAIAVLTHYLAPILVALTAPWIDGERSPNARAAALVAAAGLLLVLEPWVDHASGPTSWLGAGLGATSAVFFAGTMFCARRLNARIGPSSTIALHSLLAGLAVLPFATGGLAELDWRAASYLALGGVLPGALAGVLFVTGIGMIGASRAAVLAYLEPLVAVVVGVVVWREPVGAWAIAGALLIIAAGVAVARRTDAISPDRLR